MVTKTLEFDYNSFNYSTLSTRVEKFPVFLSIHFKIKAALLPPLYSYFSPLAKKNRVGNPFISYLEANYFSTVASTLAKITFFYYSFKVVAADSNSGAKLFIYKFKIEFK